MTLKCKQRRWGGNVRR